MLGRRIQRNGRIRTAMDSATMGPQAQRFRTGSRTGSRPATDADEDGAVDAWTEFRNETNDDGLFLDACVGTFGTSRLPVRGCPDADGDLWANTHDAFRSTRRNIRMGMEMASGTTSRASKLMSAPLHQACSMVHRESGVHSFSSMMLMRMGFRTRTIDVQEPHRAPSLMLRDAPPINSIRTGTASTTGEMHVRVVPQAPPWIREVARRHKHARMTMRMVSRTSMMPARRLHRTSRSVRTDVGRLNEMWMGMASLMCSTLAMTHPSAPPSMRRGALERVWIRTAMDTTISTGST